VLAELGTSTDADGDGGACRGDSMTSSAFGQMRPCPNLLRRRDPAVRNFACVPKSHILNLRGRSRLAATRIG
jgi:hypothetical protein